MRKSLATFVVLMWLALVVSGYYVTHKPFTPGLALNLARAAFQLGSAVALLSLAGGLGTWLGTLVGLPGEGHPWTLRMVNACLGLGSLGVLYLLVGTTLGVGSVSGWGVLLVGALLLRREIVSWWGGWGHGWRLLEVRGWLPGCLAAGAGLIALFTLTVALAPPLQFDALVYHLTLPRNYLEAGRIAYIPGNVFWGMPQGATSLYTWAMSLAGNEAAPVLGWLLGLLALAGVTGLAWQAGGARAAWMALAALTSGSTLARSLAWGYVDWVALLFGAAFLAIFTEWARGDLSRHRVLAVAGMLAGFALGVKYTAGVLAVAGLAAVLWQRRRPLRAALESGAVFSLALITAYLPWGLLNTFATGNPFYPLLFPAGAMDQVRLHFYQVHPPWGDWREVFLLPWRATFLGLDGAPGYGAAIGPLLLALGGLAWIGWRQREGDQRAHIASAAWVALPGMLVWGLASRTSALLNQTRLYLALFPALAVLAGAGYAAVESRSWPGVRLARVLQGLVVFVFGMTVLQVGVDSLRLGATQVVTANQSTERYLQENLGWYSVAIQAIQDLPEGAQVVLLWEPRSYYCTPRCEPDEVLDRWVHAMRSQSKPEELLTRWRSQGFTHLLYYRAGAGFIREDDPRYTPDEWQALDRFLETLPAPVDFGGVYTLYPLSP